jgi:hypothetical protein
VLAVYAERRGLPGASLSLGTFASFPLWEPTGNWGKAALACFFLALARGGADLRRPAAESLAGQIWALGYAALTVCLFLPWSPADYASGPSLALAAADFCLFWMKTVFYFFFAALPLRDGSADCPGRFSGPRAQPECARILFSRPLPPRFAPGVLCHLNVKIYPLQFDSRIIRRTVM